MQFEVKHDFSKLIKQYKGFANLLPKVSAKAINDTLWQIRGAEQEEMKKVFDRPTPYTLNSLQYEKATPDDQKGYIKLKDAWDKGTPAADYLMPQIIGGERKDKRSEKLLKQKGLMPDNTQLIPARGLKLDPYGNIKRSDIIKILSAVSAFKNTGSNQNVTSTSKGKRFAEKIVVVKEYIPGFLSPGIYMKHRNQGIGKGGYIHIPLVLFVTKGNYKKRYDYLGVAQKTATINIEKNFHKAMQYEISKLGK